MDTERQLTIDMSMQKRHIYHSLMVTQKGAIIVLYDIGLEKWVRCGKQVIIYNTNWNVAWRDDKEFGNE